MARRTLILTIEYDPDKADDPLQWAWPAIFACSVESRASVVSCDEFEPMVTGPWNDGGENVVFQPVYEAGFVGYHVTRGKVQETWAFAPSGGGDSPDIFVYSAEGIVPLNTACEMGSSICFLDVCTAADSSEDA